MGGRTFKMLLGNFLKPEINIENDIKPIILHMHI